MATKHTHFDSTEFNTLRNSAIPAAIMASPNTRFDSAEEASVFFARELDHVKAKTYDVEYPELTALSNFPISSEADAGDNTITYYTYDKTGLAKVIDNYSTDLPRADVTGKPSIALIKSVGDSYGYSAQEMRASRRAGKSLDVRKAESARYQIDNLINKIAWRGDEESGLMGVLSAGQNIPLYTITAGADSSKTTWLEKTAEAARSAPWHRAMAWACLCTGEARAARRWAEAFLGRKGYAPRRAAFELERKGIDGETAAQLVEELAGDPEETLLRVLQKKYGRVLGEEAGRRRAAAAMQRLGYSYEQIRRALRRAAPEITDEDEEYNGI